MVLGVGAPLPRFCGCIIHCALSANYRARSVMSLVEPYGAAL